MIRRAAHCLWLIALCMAPALPAGCDRRPVRANAAPAGPVRMGSAIIRGTVRLSGRPPAMAMIPNQPCHAGAAPFHEESVCVDDAGHLRDVVMYLEDAPPAPAATNSPPVVLDQVNCRYVPHAVALRTGQTLRVTTSDPTLHNVHGPCIDNPPFNFALVAPGQSKDLVFERPEAFAVRCDVHPWMRANVQVFDHPYFAVSAADGSYQIDHVPPGTYTLVARQEKYGAQRQRITVADGQITHADVTFASGL